MRAPGGGASCLGVGRPGSGAVPPPTTRPVGRAAGAHDPLAVGAGGAGVGTRHQPHSARSCALWGRHEGAQGGRLLTGCGAPGDGRSPNPDVSSLRVCGRGPLPSGRGRGVRASGTGCPWHLLLWRRSLCVVRASRVRGTRWPLCLGTCPRPWLWLAACLSGVPRGPTLVRRASSGLVVLGARFPVAVVPSPTPGAVAPGFTWWLRGARGGRPRTGLFVPAAGPCRGKGAGHE